MPEGPEVRRHADAVARAIRGHRVVEVAARTKGAKAWLAERPGALIGQRVEAVWAHGKHLVGAFEGGVGFHSHLMMWGRWETYPGAAPADVPLPDRRERARIVTDGGAALLLSAPVFTLFEGDPYAAVPILATLGPDALPYDGPAAFDAAAFRANLAAHAGREVGAVLLDQSVVAGLGNYLRAEILFACRIDPFAKVGSLTPADLDGLVETVPAMTAQAYATGGVTLDAPSVDRMIAEPALVYRAGAAWQRRHYVFRRTNLPCLACGTPVRQLRQVTRDGADEDEGDDAAVKKERVVYFCPRCQGVDVPERKPARKRSAAADAAVPPPTYLPVEHAG